MFKEARSRSVMVIYLEIGPRICASNWLFARRRLTSLDEKEEFGTSIGPVRWFSVKSSVDKKGSVSREEGMFPDM